MQHGRLQKLPLAGRRLTPTQLRQRNRRRASRSTILDSAALEEAMEGDNPKQTIISLVVEKLG